MTTPTHGPSAQALGRLEALMPRLGLSYAGPVPVRMVGTGFGVAWDAGRFVTVSVGSGNEHFAHITTGALADVSRDQRAGLLEQCNTWNGNLAAYPVFLHDADVGWDVIVQTSYPLPLLEQNPDFFAFMLSGLPDIADRVRGEFAAFGGRPYQWGDDDLERLLTRSLI
ncbi:MAG: hypothetical protein REI11_16375 [Patulibacter sp.]|nr:hypothetical protein [Patulibacter sp.]